MTPSLEELLDMGEKFANLTLLKLKETQLAPFYHLVTPGDDDPDVLVPCDLHSDQSKENMVAITSALAQVHNAVAVMFVSEAWMATVDKDAYEADTFVRPSENKDRVEIVALVASDGHQTRQRALRIIRNRRGRIVGLLRDKEDVSTLIGGRMIDGIIAVTAH